MCVLSRRVLASEGLKGSLLTDASLPETLTLLSLANNSLGGPFPE
jgi:hypothetical protein